MWRPRGELAEVLAVAVGSTALALGVLMLVSPRALHGVLPEREASFVERAIRSELGSLAQAQERYFEAQGRYALDLASVPWRSGLNVYVRVREADAQGFRATGSVQGRTPMRCEVAVVRRDVDTVPRTERRIACRAGDGR